MKKLKKIFQSTVAKVITSLLVIGFLASLFFYFEFYEKQAYKALGYYLVYKGDKAFKKQDLQKAIYLYEKGILYHPEHYRAMYNLANIYVVYEDYYAALKNYEKALLIRPDYEMARMNYAIILSETYKTDEAIEQYKKVIANKPKFIKIPFLIDNKKSHNYNIGVAYYNMGIAYRTKSLLAGLNKQLNKHYLEKAQDSYSEAATILKTYNSNYNLALIHQLLKERYQAAHYYCKAMEISPLDYEAHFNYAIILNDMGMYPEALEEFQRAILLLNLKQDKTRSNYMFNVLLDVNQKIALFKDDKELKRLVSENFEEEVTSNKKDKKKKKFRELNTYKAGKLVLDDPKADENLTKEYSQCVGKGLFLGEK